MSYSFNGTSQVLYSLSPPATSFGAPITTPSFCFSAWIKPAVHSGLQIVFCVLGADNGTYFYMDAAGKMVAAMTGGHAPATSVASAAVGAWSHVVLNCTSGTVFEMWLNNVKANDGGPGLGGDPAAYERFSIGAFFNTTGPTFSSYFNGLIAAPSIFTGPLADAQIAALYYGRQPKRITFSGLRNYWPLSEPGMLNGAFGDPLTAHNAPTYSMDSPRLYGI